jgi:hypothetical protein
MTEIDLEKRVRLLENSVVTDVWYEQMENGTVRYDGGNFHSVDTAIYLRMTNNKTFKIFWADEFGLYHGFGISVKEAGIVDKDNGEFVDTTQDRRWLMVEGKKIVSAGTHWKNVLDDMRSGRVPFLGMGYIRRRDYPQTVELSFEGGSKIFVSAMKISDEGVCIPFTNSLTVFFDERTIEGYYKPLRKL